ncbi:helix-turn-helix domain-containing protein [Lysinibacillus boronitolerans]|uniref:helix-turn-helix domain-containing protein n=1 Tax=Lysinibacillus boronitolerans TaxID=309788 RepID=UPI00385235A8
MYREELFIESFANELRRKREEQSLTLSQLAENSSVSATFTMRLENGKRKNASIEVIFKLANALEIDISDLVQKCKI